MSKVIKNGTMTLEEVKDAQNFIWDEFYKKHPNANVYDADAVRRYNKLMADMDEGYSEKFLKYGGRIKSALAKDRKYTSDQDHEKSYSKNRKSRVIRYKKSLKQGGSISNDDLYELYPDSWSEAKERWSKLSKSEKDFFISDLDSQDAASENISDSWLEFVNASSEEDYWENSTNFEEFGKGGPVGYDTRDVKGSAKLHSKNTHFAIHKPTNSIVEAWNYKGEDKDELRDSKDDYFWEDVKNVIDGSVDKFIKSDYIIVEKSKLSSKGIDLNNYKAFGGQEYAKGGGVHTMPNGEVMKDSEHYGKGGPIKSAEMTAEDKSKLEDFREGLKNSQITPSVKKIIEKRIADIEAKYKKDSSGGKQQKEPSKSEVNSVVRQIESLGLDVDNKSKDPLFYLQSPAGELIWFVQNFIAHKKRFIITQVGTSENSISRDMLEHILNEYSGNFEVVLVTNSGTDLHSSEKGMFKNAMKIIRISELSKFLDKKDVVKPIEKEVKKVMHGKNLVKYISRGTLNNKDVEVGDEVVLLQDVTDEDILNGIRSVKIRLVKNGKEFNYPLSSLSRTKPKSPSKSTKKKSPNAGKPNNFLQDMHKMAKDIRKDGEKYSDAAKRASEILRGETPKPAPVKKATKKTVARKKAIPPTKKTVVKKKSTPVKKKKKVVLKKVPQTERGLKSDGNRQALPAGKRRSASGKVYYERRSNKSDATKSTTKGEMF